ncbi:ring-1,2-phenylacetyl-CoA epoxidase subunit PaaB [Melghirimyces thermohalophilus]|uniref:Ring-1,2-phenylacetyl-CoA epoxidase subunit PaaB n=1 Tax=Melghirimyces thermohalophilus TaxID=1236220 RepID=A0A1G6LEA5_9BACL|nr:phenylacetic acid degradation protein [Melghirimyces thermohalophilus]SDC41544.1 ring-1,2-phenylacetyl-CoA epoxidase subunit PaaB [Melghirimyces thermohalophilus]
MADRREYEVFEVFVRKKKTDAHVHVGSLNAPSPDIALTTARENFLRRENAVNLWVVPRGEIHETPCDEGDWFARELDRKYREVSGYSENGRLWKTYRERALYLEEIVQDLHPPSQGNRPRPRRERT